MTYEVEIIESGRHNLNGQRASVVIDEVRGRTTCSLFPARSQPLAWIAVGWSAEGNTITIQGPNTLWTLEVV